MKNQQRTIKNRKEMNLVERIDALNNYGVHLPTATIYIAGEIDANLATALRFKYHMIKDFFREEKEPLHEINIIMNSCGGDASAIASVLDFYEELEKYDKVKVNVQVEGNCMSAATFILGGATGVRKANKRCRFMVHEIQIEGMGGTHTQTKAFQTELNRMQDECYELYAQFSYRNDRREGKDPSKEDFDARVKMWEKLSTKETYLGAERALELGLIDEIL